MKIPFIKYVETLIVGRLSINEIFMDLQSLGMELPAVAITYILDTFKGEVPEYFEDINSLPDSAWLNTLGIEKMYGYKFKLTLPGGVLGIDGAFRIVNDPLMYRLITAMALVGITDEDIELIVNGKYNIEYSSEDITNFLHYFFNLEGWTMSDKQKYVNSLDKPELKTAYAIALKGDKDYLLWKLGAAPDKSFVSMLRDMMVDSYYNFKERSKTDPDLAQRWGTLAIKLTDRIDKSEKEDGQQKDMYADIQFMIKGASNIDANQGPVSSVVFNLKTPHIAQINEEPNE